MTSTSLPTVPTNSLLNLNNITNTNTSAPNPNPNFNSNSLFNNRPNPTIHSTIPSSGISSSDSSPLFSSAPLHPSQLLPSSTSSSSLPQSLINLISLLSAEHLSYDPAILPLLLDVEYSLTTKILSLAYEYRDRRGGSNLEDADLEMAIHSLHYTQPQPIPTHINSPSLSQLSAVPARELIHSLAASRNSIPLPLLPTRAGLLLPPDRYCLTGIEWEFKGGEEDEHHLNEAEKQK